MNSEIYKSFIETRQPIDGHIEYPSTSGIYSVFLKDTATLFDFGTGGQLIYSGIAKHSLHDRDFNQHFQTGKTGSSTLRRSIGAILKTKLMLTAIPRGGETDSKRFDNYKFVEEQVLTDWMVLNLEIGYWVSKKPMNYKQLRDVEKRITIEFKPTLDLDNRTRRFNPFAGKLVMLRDICKIEAGK